MSNKSKRIISIVINAYLLISMLIIVIAGVSTGPSDAQPGFEEMVGIGYLKAYTNLSNIMVGLVGVILIAFSIKSLCSKSYKTPSWVIKLHYVTAVAITVTFVTVVVFLSPMTALKAHNISGYLSLFKGDMFFFHFLNPVLCVLDYMLLQDKEAMSLKDNFLALLPVIIYAILYMIEVVGLGNWSDFYGFTFGGNYGMIPVSLIAMLSSTYLYGFVYRKLKK